MHISGLEDLVLDGNRVAAAAVSGPVMVKLGSPLEAIVPSIRCRSIRRSRTDVDDDIFDDLCTAFHNRLQSERAHFVTLSAALACAEEEPVRIFHDLRDRAHKIHKGAAALEIAEIASAAHTLELAAVAASGCAARHSDAAVWTALVSLVRVMGTLDLGDRALMAALAH
jgi:HPt (histidine-containing phosphotransfer) domain-containing protein